MENIAHTIQQTFVTFSTKYYISLLSECHVKSENAEPIITMTTILLTPCISLNDQLLTNLQTMSYIPGILGEYAACVLQKCYKFEAS